MEFDRGGNANGVEFGVRLRCIVNHHLAGLLLRTTRERLLITARIDLRGIGDKQLYNLAIRHLNHKPRLISQAIQTREYALDTGAGFSSVIPGFWFRRNRAIRV